MLSRVLIICRKNKQIRPTLNFVKNNSKLGLCNLGLVGPVGLPSNLDQIRTTGTYVLKRRFETRNVREDLTPTEEKIYWDNYIYELHENTEVKQEPMSVLLLKAIPGIGAPGQIVKLNRKIGRFKVIMTGLGIYASPENVEKYKDLIEKGDEHTPSSAYVLKTVQMLEKKCISVNVNLDNPWTIEPWHIRVAFRKNGVVLPEEVITLPSEPITGPDLEIENKEFYVTLKLNNKEEARVRVRIHHVATDYINRLPWTERYWEKRAEPLFPEEAPVLDTLMANVNYWVEDY